MAESALFKYCPNLECPFYLRHGKRGEYRGEFDACSDCGTALVPSSELPSSSSNRDESGGPASEETAGLVFLERFTDNIQASGARALLEAHGIRSFIQGEQHRSMLGFMGPYIDLNLWVSRGDLAQAKELLAQAGVVAPDELNSSSTQLDVEHSDVDDELKLKRQQKLKRFVWAMLVLGFVLPASMVVLNLVLIASGLLGQNR